MTTAERRRAALVAGAALAMLAAAWLLVVAPDDAARDDAAPSASPRDAASATPDVPAPLAPRADAPAPPAAVDVPTAAAPDPLRLGFELHLAGGGTPTTLEAVVFDDSGERAAGLEFRVRVHGDSSGVSTRLVRTNERGELRAHDLPAPCRLEIDALGAARLAIPPDRLERDALLHLTYERMRESVAPHVRHILLPDAAAPLELVALRTSAALRGRLLGPDGTPRDGVELTLWRRGERADPFLPEWERRPESPGWEPLAHARSNALGHFAFPELPPGRVTLLGSHRAAPLEVEVFHLEAELRAAEAHELGDVVVPADAHAQHFALVPELDGAVVDLAALFPGEEPPEAEVLLHGLGDAPGFALAGRHAVGSTMRVRGVPAGRWRPTALGDGGGGLNAGLRAGTHWRALPAHELPGAPVDLPVPYEALQLVHLAVENARVAPPPAALELRFFRENAVFAGSLEVALPLEPDPFAFALPTGRFALVAVDALHAAEAFPPLLAVRSLSAAPGEPTRCTLTLRDPASLSGVLTDADGAPLPAHTVGARPAGLPRSDTTLLPGLGWTSTDDLGRWRLDDLPAHTPFDLLAHPRGERPPRALRRDVPTGPPGVDTPVDLTWPDG